MEVQEGFVVPEIGVENPVEPTLANPIGDEAVARYLETQLEHSSETSEPEQEQVPEVPTYLVTSDELEARIQLVVEDVRQEIAFLRGQLGNLQVIVEDLVSRIEDHNLRSAHKI
jgi:hypothetical protein